MSNLNIIDALIISIGVNIIFNPFIKTFIRRSLSLALTTNLPKQPSTIEVDLPDDVITIILSKLDIITLHSCTTALSSLDAFLPEIVSLVAPLPESFFVPDTPLLTKDLRRFIKKLRGLKLLEVELPAFIPCEGLEDRPNLWFKWDGKIGVHGVANYFVLVFGDTVDDEIYGNERLRVQEEIRRGNMITERLSNLPWLAADLGCEGGSWKPGLTFRIKDVGRNGSFEIGPHTHFTAVLPRTRIFRLASTSMFSKDSEQVEDVILMIQLIHGKRYDEVDVVNAYLRDSYDEFEESNQTTTTMTKLKQVVKQILADENCKSVNY